MRFYELKLTRPGGNEAAIVWTSHPNGAYDARAQNIVFDIPVTIFDLPAGASVITVEGIDPNQVHEYSYFVGYGIELSVGMLGGLPLSANQPTPGPVFVGQVLEGFANWIGTELTLTFVSTASWHTMRNPGNFILNWPKGTPLTNALQNTFNLVYPNKPLVLDISPDLIQNHNATGAYSTLPSFARAVKRMTEGGF